MSDERQEKNDLDWESRTLCIDGNCIGIIGPDGCCKECGTAYVGNLDQTSADKSTDEPSDESVTAPPLEENDSVEFSAIRETVDAEEGDLDWESRTLCSDGNCIGLIGADGLCKECGKPVEEEPNDE